MSGGLCLERWDGQPAAVHPAYTEIAAQTLAILTEHPRPDPWGCYLAHAGGEVVGTCAFKAAPDDEGTVELAYMTFPPHEGRGYATAMIAALLAIAREGGATCAIAHTLRTMNPSAKALTRNGFAMLEEVEDPDDGPVWYWERELNGDAA